MSHKLLCPYTTSYKHPLLTNHAQGDAIHEEGRILLCEGQGSGIDPHRSPGPYGREGGCVRGRLVSRSAPLHGFRDTGNYLLVFFFGYDRFLLIFHPVYEAPTSPLLFLAFMSGRVSCGPFLFFVCPSIDSASAMGHQQTGVSPGRLSQSTGDYILQATFRPRSRLHMRT